MVQTTRAKCSLVLRSLVISSQVHTQMRRPHVTPTMVHAHRIFPSTLPPSTMVLITSWRCCSDTAIHQLVSNSVPVCTTTRTSRVPPSVCHHHLTRVLSNTRMVLQQLHLRWPRTAFSSSPGLPSQCTMS